MMLLLLLYEIGVNKRIEYFYDWLWVFLIPIVFDIYYRTLWNIKKKKEYSIIIMSSEDLLSSMERFTYYCEMQLFKSVQLFSYDIRKEGANMYRFVPNIDRTKRDKIWYMRKKDPSIMSDEEFLEHCERFQKNCKIEFVYKGLGITFAERRVINLFCNILLMLSSLIWLLTIVFVNLNIVFVSTFGSAMVGLLILLSLNLRK
jgi:hypothetical protein